MGQKLYCVTWRNDPTNTCRCWLEADTLPPKFKLSVDKKRNFRSATRINVIVESSVVTKMINTAEDWLSFKYNFALPIEQKFRHNGRQYTFYALNMYSLFMFYLHYVLGHYDIIGNGARYSILTELLEKMDVDVHNYIEPRLLYITILTALKHDPKIAGKLYKSKGNIIEEKHYGITLYTTMLMFVREQYIILTGDSGSMDLQGFKNPIPHIYGIDNLHLL